jgi:hypothetical protein
VNQLNFLDWLLGPRLARRESAPTDLAEAKAIGSLEAEAPAGSPQAPLALRSSSVDSAPPRSGVATQVV